MWFGCIQPVRSVSGLPTGFDRSLREAAVCESELSAFTLVVVFVENIVSLCVPSVWLVVNTG